MISFLNCNFYKDLYNEKESLHSIELEKELNGIEINKLDINQSKTLEGTLNYDEVSSTLKNMKNDKSPGSDGFTVNFFKMFWGKIGYFVVRAINHAFKCNNFSRSIKLGIITCIPKDNKPKQFLKNWRPITLLNTVYKIASGSIANRLKKVLDILISKDQSGFLRGRYIGENTRLLYDIMNFTENNQIPGLVMLIDFEKAFDSVSFDFIEKTLLFFKFGEDFLKWIKLFLYNTDVAVQLNGFISDFFTVGRGCRQGDPISPYIFILCAEILSILIKNNDRIKGITIDGEEYKISQYADDTFLLLDGSDKSLNTALDTLDRFSFISGLTMNFEKTKIIWIGAKKYSTSSIKTKWKLSWGDTRFKLLGITFDVNLEKMIELNFEQSLIKIKNRIKHWKRRMLTPIGKITVIKSLLLPTLIHLFSSLPNPGQNFLNQLREIFKDYIWGKRAKIKKSILTKEYSEGGMNMIDIDAFICTLKIKWLKNYLLNSETKCYMFMKNIFDIKKVLNCGKSYCAKLVLCLKNPFWKDVLKSYITFINKYEIDNLDQILNMPLFYNDKFHPNDTFYIKSLYNRGIRLVKDIIDKDGLFVSIKYIENTTGEKLNFLTYLSLKTAIKTYIQTLNIDLKDMNINPTHPCLNCYAEKIITGKDLNKSIYKTLIKNNDIPSSQNKWMSLHKNLNIDWNYVYSFAFTCKKDTYSQWFQLRINHRILGTNALLVKMKMIKNPLCSFCNLSEETLAHLFYQCPKINDIIQFIMQKLLEHHCENNIDKITVLLGSRQKNVKLDSMLIEFKTYIYSC